MRPPRLRRLLQLYAGLLLYGISDSMLLLAGLGVDPWDVLHQGLSRRLGLGVGTWAVIIGVLVLLMWIPLRQRPGFGTLSNVIIVGLVIDAMLVIVPPVHGLALRLVVMVAGVVLNGIATGAYIGAGLGPGPRDGLMTGMAARGHSIRVVRTCIEVTVLITGWLLGGTVGLGTVVYALGIGPIAHISIPLLQIRVSALEPTSASSSQLSPLPPCEGLNCTDTKGGSMRRMRVAAAIVLVGCGLLTLAIASAGHPTTASAAASPPAVTTSSASELTNTTATLSGTVNPNGQATTYFFEYGTTTTYGTQTSPANVGSGNTPVGVHQAIFGLTPNTTYHYRLVATNAAGTTNGTDQTFTTPTTTTSQTVVLGHEGFVSPGSIVGAEVGCFHGTTTCTGHLTMSHGGVTIAQRDYSIPADSGGFQNMELNSTGQQDLKSNGVFNLLGVTVTATPTGGQPSTWTIHLARWVWH